MVEARTGSPLRVARLIVAAHRIRSVVAGVRGGPADDTALDGVDRLLLDAATDHLEAHPDDSAPVVVLDDPAGGLTSAVAELIAARAPGPTRPTVRSRSDSRRASRAIASAVRDPNVWSAQAPEEMALGPALLDGAGLVLFRLPKSLAALDEIAAAIACRAGPDVHLLAGGRVRHMSRGMNTTLAEHFGRVRASLGAYKSRLLVATEPRPGTVTPYPQCRDLPADAFGSAGSPPSTLTVCAHGGAFGGPALDVGTRSLASFFDRLPEPADQPGGRVVDLGCGTGALAVLLARRYPDAMVWAVDDSWAAVQSAAATAASNGLADRVHTVWADALETFPDGSLDLVVCNPPFHRGTAKDSSVAYAMVAEAGRALRPGGELWTVFNSHLPYLTALRRRVGRTEVLGQDRHFTVTRSRRPGRLVATA